MSDQNPFLIPDNAKPGAGQGTPVGRSVDAGRAIEWLKQGWEYFMKNPGVWIAMAVILLVIYFVLGMIPFLGFLASSLLAPVLTAGMLIGCKSLADGGELRIDQLFAGFKQNVGNLVVVGVLNLVGFFLIGLVVAFLVGGAALTGGMIGQGRGAGVAAGGFMLAMLVAFALSVPLLMAIWFAPALVVFRDVGPLEAIKASFAACLNNIVPFLVYGVITFVLFFIAVLPLGLGLIVLMPVILGSIYAAYVEIFE